MTCRLPWVKRAEFEKRRAEDARKRLAEVEADTARVHAAVEGVAREVRLNGFLDDILRLNEGRR